jgi:hypothetical protein
MRAAAVNQYGTGKEGRGDARRLGEGEVQFVDIPFMVDDCGRIGSVTIKKIERKGR